MKYLLDTNVISDIVAGVPEVTARYLYFSPRALCISTVTVKEIEYGLRRNPQRALKIRRPIEGLLSSITILPFKVEDARHCGYLRCELARAGTPIGPWDVMIAATALTQGLVLVTANSSEFSRVPGLRMEDWRRPINQVHEESVPYGTAPHRAA